MTHSGLLRWVTGLWLVLTGMASAQSFTDQVTGVYTTSPDFDFAVQLTLWPEGDGFSGDALIAAARYPVYAEQDGPALRGVFDVGGTLQRFTFLPSTSGQIAVQFSGEPAPIIMARTALPAFTGHYSGDFGALSVRQREGEIVAEFVSPSGATSTGSGVAQGLRVSFPDLSALIYFEPGESAYYVDLPYFYGAVSPAEAPLRVGGGANADYATLADALASAAPGSTIELMPGTYQGPFSVTRNVAIMGRGEAEEVVLTADGGQVLEWTAARGSLSNLSVEVPAGGTGIVVNGGSMLSGITIRTEQQATGIRVSGSADVSIQSADISGGDHAIVAQSFRGHLTVADSSLNDTQKSIFSVADVSPESRITLHGNTLAESPSNGIRLTGAGEVELRENTMRDVRVGVYQNGGASTVLFANEFASIGAHGLWFEGKMTDALDLTGNEITEVAEACILFNNFAFPAKPVSLSQSTVYGCGGFGLVVAGAETVSVGNDLELHTMKMEDNGTHLAFYAPVSMLGRDLVFSKSSGPAIILGENIELELTSAIIRDTGDHGIVAIGNGLSLDIADTEIHSAKKSGLVLSGKSRIGLHQTDVSRNGGNGIELHQGAVVDFFEDISVTDNGGAGVLVSGTVFSPGKNVSITDNAGGDILRQ